MGYMLALSPCFTCHRLISYNPDLVPSYRDPRTGQKEPVCGDCIAAANPKRIANGLDPIVILPGAYEAGEA